MVLACCSFSMRHLAIAIAVSLALLFSVPDAAAQASRVGATLQGTVSDTSGAVIPNSKVTLHNPLTNQSRTVTTDEQGFFRAEQLRSEEHTSELQSLTNLVCRLLLEK